MNEALQAIMEIIPVLTLILITIAVIVGIFLSTVGKNIAGKPIGIFKSLASMFKPELLSKDEGATFMSGRKTKNIFSPRNKGLLVGNNLRLTREASFTHLAMVAPT